MKGGKTVLKEIIDNKRYSFRQNCNNWKEAVRFSCIPLIEDDVITEEYAEKIIESITKYGPYIIITQDVAIPHSALGQDGVKKCGIGFMKVEEPVYFIEGNTEKRAKIFFTLAANNPDEHLKKMEELTNILINDERLEKIKNVKNIDELKKISEEYNV